MNGLNRITPDPRTVAESRRRAEERRNLLVHAMRDTRRADLVAIIRAELHQMHHVEMPS